MAQVTIYLEDHLVEELKQAAEAEDVSKSRWISNLIRKKFSNTWPSEVESLAGAWESFPEDVRDDLGEDLVREEL